MALDVEESVKSLTVPCGAAGSTAISGAGTYGAAMTKSWPPASSAPASGAAASVAESTRTAPASVLGEGAVHAPDIAMQSAPRRESEVERVMGTMLVETT